MDTLPPLPAQLIRDVIDVTATSSVNVLMGFLIVFILFVLIQFIEFV